jgi:urocanate hydratase
MADRQFAGDLSGKLVVSGGMGGMGGAQPLAATLNGAVFLGIEVDPARIERRVRTGYCDRIAMSLDEALDICEDARDQKRAISVGLVGNCAEILPELVRRGVQVDAVTDQTSAHDPLNGYVPAGMSLDEAAELREKDAAAYVE